MERVRRDREESIVTQSSLKFCIEYLNLIGVKNLTMKEMFRLASVVGDQCMYVPDDNFNEVVKAVDQWLREKKKKEEES